MSTYWALYSPYQRGYVSAFLSAGMEKDAASKLRKSFGLVPDVDTAGRWWGHWKGEPIGAIDVGSHGGVSWSQMGPNRAGYDMLGLPEHSVLGDPRQHRLGSKMYGELIRRQPNLGLSSDSYMSSLSTRAWERHRRTPGYGTAKNPLSSPGGFDQEYREEIEKIMKPVKDRLKREQGLDDWDASYEAEKILKPELDALRDYHVPSYAERQSYPYSELATRYGVKLTDGREISPAYTTVLPEGAMVGPEQILKELQEYQRLQGADVSTELPEWVFETFHEKLDDQMRPTSPLGMASYIMHRGVPADMKPRTPAEAQMLRSLLAKESRGWRHGRIPEWDEPGMEDVRDLWEDIRASIDEAPYDPPFVPSTGPTPQQIRDAATRAPGVNPALWARRQDYVEKKRLAEEAEEAAAAQGLTGAAGESTRRGMPAQEWSRRFQQPVDEIELAGPYEGKNLRDLIFGDLPKQPDPYGVMGSSQEPQKYPAKFYDEHGLVDWDALKDAGLLDDPETESLFDRFRSGASSAAERLQDYIEESLGEWL